MKKETQFTDGPWRWLDGNNLMGDHGKRPIILSAQRLYARTPDGTMRPNDPKLPDALLIAAAPMLYAQLRETATDAHSLSSSNHPDVKFAECPHWSCVNARTALELAEPKQ